MHELLAFNIEAGDFYLCNRAGKELYNIDVLNRLNFLVNETALHFKEKKTKAVLRGIYHLNDNLYRAECSEFSERFLSGDFSKRYFYFNSLGFDLNMDQLFFYYTKRTIHKLVLLCKEKKMCKLISRIIEIFRELGGGVYDFFLLASCFEGYYKELCTALIKTGRFTCFSELCHLFSDPEKMVCHLDSTLDNKICELIRNCYFPKEVAPSFIDVRVSNIPFARVFFFNRKRFLFLDKVFFDLMAVLFAKIFIVSNGSISYNKYYRTLAAIKSKMAHIDTRGLMDGWILNKSNVEFDYNYLYNPLLKIWFVNCRQTLKFGPSTYH